MNTRLAISMWDFSWLTRRQKNEAEYSDWNRVLDELVDRGYNCIRIDAFPHLIADLPDGKKRDQFTILPEPWSKQWGNTIPVTVEPKKSLVEFITMAKERNLKIGLSTWFNPDTLKIRSTVQYPQDYTRIWEETLQLLSDEGLNDCIAWVDLCNEFPFIGYAYGAYRNIFNSHASNILPCVLNWSKKARNNYQYYIDNSIGALKKKFPNHKYTYSFASPMSKNVLQSNTDIFDIAEPHVWLTDNPRFYFLSMGFLSLLRLPSGAYINSKIAPIVYYPLRKYWLSILNKHMDDIAKWADDQNLPLYTSESWATVMYGDLNPEGKGKEWKWIKDICRQGVYMAIEKGWQGISTSNFSQPHFKGIWKDKKWHQELTSAIRNN